jgi:two-component system chemotaxis sensor kinase CheA
MAHRRRESRAEKAKPAYLTPDHARSSSSVAPPLVHNDAMLTRLALIVAAALSVSAALAAEPAAPPAASAPAAAAAPAAAPAPAPVYLEILDEHDAKRASVAKSRATGEEQLQTQARVVGALDTMRHIGFITANAALMLIGSLVVGVLLALVVVGIRRLRAGKLA